MRYYRKDTCIIASPRLRLLPTSMQGKWACFVSQVRWKERRKEEEGAIKFYNFLLSPKGPNEWRNIPFKPPFKEVSLFYSHASN